MREESGHGPLWPENAPALPCLLSLTVSRTGMGESNSLPLSEDRSVSPAGPEASEETDGPGSISITLCPQPCPAQEGHSSKCG